MELRLANAGHAGSHGGKAGHLFVQAGAPGWKAMKNELEIMGTVISKHFFWEFWESIFVCMYI